jgi:glyoxylase-like metal-dependent hydrolase (beta-lactamase superfamily II)
MVRGRVAEVRPLGEGEVIRARHVELRVLHVPGHTPGLLNLHASAQGLLFSADHLLEKVSPNPLIELGPHGEEGYFRPLVAYLSSIARVRALDLSLVLPGHAEPFSEHRPVIDRLVDFYGKRQRRIRELLDARPRTAWELARELFPRAQVAQTFLVISETLANLEVLEARGEVARSDVDGVWRFG